VATRATWRIYPSEKEFAQAVVDLARRCGWMVFRDVATNAHRRCPRCKETIHGPRNPPGWPDLVLVRERVIYVELKVGRGTLSPEQVAWRDALTTAGQEWHEWRPAQMQQIGEVLAA
jgi:hypothetical protein